MELGLLFAILSPITSSITAIFRSGATKLLNPFVVLSFSSLFGSLILFSFILFKHRNISWHTIRLHWKDLLTLTITRQILGQCLFTFGLYYTTAIKAIFLTKVEPYFVVFWFWFFKREAIHPKHFFLLGVHILGAILLSGAEARAFTKSQLGDILIVLAMCFFSYSYFSATKVSHALGALQSNAIMLFLSGLFFLPFAILYSDASVWHVSTGWYYILLDAFIFSTISLSMWFASLKSVKGWMVSAMRALGPLVGAPFAFFLFGETLTFVQLLGGALVLGTSFLIALEHLKATTKTR